MTLQETLTRLRDEKAESYTYPNWPKKHDHERPERYSTFMQYEVAYTVHEAHQDGFTSAQDLLLPLIEKWKTAFEEIDEQQIESVKRSYKHIAREALSELKKLEEGLGKL